MKDLSKKKFRIPEPKIVLQNATFFDIPYFISNAFPIVDPTSATE